MFWNCFMKLKWTNSNVATSPIFDGLLFFDGLLHVIKSLIILMASFVRGYIMMLKWHEWSQEIWSKNVIFKCKNYVPHLLFHVQIVFFGTKFYCPNKSINYFFKVDTKLSTSFRKINVNKFLNWYDLNMYIINVIADDQSKIGLYEIYFLND
jgi:hypothetical protein